MISTFVVVLLVLKLLFWSMLIASGIWLYRQFRLKSLLCLGIVLGIMFLSFPVDVLEEQAIDSMEASVTPLHWSKGEFIISWGYLKQAVENTVKAIVALLIIGDVVLSLSELGVSLEGRIFRKFTLVHQKNLALSTLAVILTLIIPLAKVGFYLYYG